MYVSLSLPLPPPPLSLSLSLFLSAQTDSGVKGRGVDHPPRALHHNPHGVTSCFDDINSFSLRGMTQVTSIDLNNNNNRQ